MNSSAIASRSSDCQAVTASIHSAAAGTLAPTRTLPLTADLTAADPLAAKRQEIRVYFHKTWELYDRLFALIQDDESFYDRHEPLRHPLIFYWAHPAVFFINKLIAGRFIATRVDSQIEAIMAVGVDEMSWDDLHKGHYDWPSVNRVRDYRRAVRERIDEFILEMPLELPIRQDSAAWMILMGIEHERIHLETSSVIMRQMPLKELRCDNELTNEEKTLWSSCLESGAAPDNSWIEMPAQEVTLGKLATDATFGWDNEYGLDTIHLPAFSAAKYLTSNAAFLEFVKAGGYRNEAYWTEEGRGWLHYTRAQHPKFWFLRDQEYWQRNLLNERILPLNWPVEVNCLEAQAFCAWQREQTGLSIQLPSEAHWQALRQSIPDDDGGPTGELCKPNPPPQGNIGLAHFASSVPVDRFPQGKFYDVVGNVWQWTRTPIMPFKGFEVHPLYDDFSVPTFDGRHNLMKGGSWIATGNEAITSARYAFRRHFFQHAGFRTIIDAPGHDCFTEGSKLYETDRLVTQYLEFHYGPLSLGVPNFPQACVAAAMQHVEPSQTGRCLDIGCSVGRSAFEFAQHFGHVDAIDFSARFIQSGVQLQQGREVLYEIPTEGELTISRSVSLEQIGLSPGGNRVAFLQGDACNLKPLVSDYDLVFAGNLIDRLYDPALFLDDIATRLRPGGLLVITSPYTWLEEYTQKNKWLGGRREHGEPLTTFAGLSQALAKHFSFIHRQDIPFVIRETSRKHQYTLAEMTIWRKV